MKNKLLAELKELATKILQITDQNSASLKLQAKDLYEKLTILAFTEENLASFSDQSSSKMEIRNQETMPINNKESYASEKQEIVKVEEKDEYLPDGTEYNDTESIIEQNTEKIKDIVAEMPPETHAVDYMVNKIISANGAVKKSENTSENASENNKRDFRDIGVDYDNLPDFQPVKQQDKERPRSINDRLKKGINIGLNERLAFIRHLFDGKAADYNRVISQLNTFSSIEESRKFIRLVVKPDYKNWVGKEEFEKKFMELVENKFNK